MASGCWDLKNLIEQNPISQDDDADSLEGREGLSEYPKLSFNGKIAPAFKSISAIGTNGRRSHLYFGSSNERKKLFVYDVATKSVVDLDTRVKKPGQEKFEKHDKAGFYNAASKASTISAPKNPSDETTITMIVSGPNEHAIIGLSGLTHRRGGIIGTSAHGGVMEVEGAVVKGIWGNVLGSLNSSESKEIQSLAVLKDSWIAFSKDKKGVGAFRKFGEAPDQATEGPTGILGQAIGTIVTAAVGAGSDLFVAYDGSVYLRKTHDVNEICEIDLGAEAQGLNEVAKAEELQIFPEAQDVMIVSAMAVVGRTLLIGLENYSQNSGGVARVYLDTPSLGVVRPPRSQLGMSIKHIAVGEDGRSAMISTDGRGLLYYFDNVFVELSEKTLPSLSDVMPSEKYPLVLEGKQEALQQGFDFSKANIGAAKLGAVWYIATSEGIYQLKESIEKLK